MRAYMIAATLLLLPTPAVADCQYATGPCATDRYGNTYENSRNQFGGYSTYRNGQPYADGPQLQVPGNDRRMGQGDWGSARWPQGGYEPLRPR